MSSKPTNQKRRNNEKRKEKSRVAARCRRTKEMQIFSELTAALPARKEEVEQLDKASVMRLAISYLKVRDMVSLLPNVNLETAELIKNPKGLEEVSSELSYMKALDGFVLVLSQNGDFVYCSENIADHLGISQMDIMGQSVFEFSHPCDHDEIREALRCSDNGRRELLLRLKCTLTSKGRNVHLKSASYKVIHVTGHMLAQPSDNSTSEANEESKNEEENKNKNGALVAVGRPIPHPSNIEIPLDSKTFLTKHGLDMKFTYTDETLLKTLGFEEEELLGRSLYDYHHAGDSAQLVQQFKSLFSKGQCETGQYRFLAKRGGYAWVQTQATVITDKMQKPLSVVCVNYIVSGIECKDEVFAAHQVKHAILKRTPRSLDLPNGAIVAAIPLPEEQPIPVTELIFVPRKKEMNKGFLMFSQDEGLTMLKDEPDDLTHLAPTAGDACIPLENSPFDMFDEFILSDNYCSLLGDDLANGSPVDSLTDSLLMSSPEPQENDSSCEKSSLLTELSLDAFDSGRSDNDIDDGHSPYIPSSDELPILEQEVMWGALPDSVSQARPQPPPDTSPSAPALQRLLAEPPTGPPPQDLVTNIYSDQGLVPSRNIPSWDTGTGMKRMMKEDVSTNAKRAKRSPSPVQGKPQSSSVLMNLLDLPEPPPQRTSRLPYQNFVTAQKPPPKSTESINIPTPVPIASLLQAASNKSRNIPEITFDNVNTSRSDLQSVANMSPLTLNVSSMYSLPSSPYSPISPNTYKYRNNRATSPYSPSLSPQSYQNKRSPPLVRGTDPYLINKMQPSPNFVTQNDSMMIDSNMPMLTNDFWNDNEMIQDTTELLTAFDDVKLI